MPPYLRAPHGVRLRNLRLSRLEIHEIAISFWLRYDESPGGIRSPAARREAAAHAAGEALATVSESERSPQGGGGAGGGRGGGEGGGEGGKGEGEGEGEGEGGEGGWPGVGASFDAFVKERAEAARWDAVARASWAHSVLDACKVWGGTGLSDVALLHESLLGAPLVPRAAQRAMLAGVLAAFDDAHSAEGKGWLLVRSGSSLASAANKMSSAGELKRSSIAPLLRDLFPSRPGEHIDQLAHAVSLDQPHGDMVQYHELLLPPQPGAAEPPALLEALKRQQQQAPHEFMARLERALCAQDAGRLSGHVSWAEAAAALDTADPHHAPGAAIRLLRCGFGLDPAHGQEREAPLGEPPLPSANATVDIGTFCDRVLRTAPVTAAPPAIAIRRASKEKGSEGAHASPHTKRVAISEGV